MNKIIGDKMICRFYSANGSPLWHLDVYIINEGWEYDILEVLAEEIENYYKKIGKDDEVLIILATQDCFSEDDPIGFFVVFNDVGEYLMDAETTDLILRYILGEIPETELEDKISWDLFNYIVENIDKIREKAIERINPVTEEDEEIIEQLKELVSEGKVKKGLEFLYR